jgi:hypothetical protein
MHKPLLAALRVLSTIAIAGIAAWVSYWHMQDVAVRYGETQVSAYLLPISVDGLIVVASVSLVELAGRIRVVEDARAKAALTAMSAPTVAPVQFVQPPTPVAPPAAVPVFQAPATPVLAAPPEEVISDEELEEVLDDEAAEPLSVGGPAHGSVRTPSVAPVSPAVGPTTYVNGSTAPARPAATRAAAATATRTMVTESTAPRPRRPVIETAELADAIVSMDPKISEEDLAKRLNISVARLRQVRKEAEARRAAGAVRQ